MSRGNRRDFLKAAGAGAAAAIIPCRPRSARSEAMPNIVFILADDLGYGDLGCQNPNSKIPTPNLDRLAEQGVRFTDAHSPSAVCTPTRYSVLTGRYCWRSSLKRGVLLGYSPPLIEPGRATVASVLRKKGYRTAAIGKWHLGLEWAVKDGANPGQPEEKQIDFTRPIGNGPTTRGFDYFFGISASLDMPPYVFIENDRVVAQPTDRQEPIQTEFVRAGAKDPGFSFEAVLPTLTKKAVQFIGEQSGREAPLFLYFPLNAPHTPVAPAPGFSGRSRAGAYGDYVAEVDWAVGQVLDALEKSGLGGNTLVVVTSDNGPEVSAYPRAEQHGHYSMGGLRGVKRDTWEGGHRVPFIARWPGRIPAGSISDETISLVDLMTTAAAITGAALPKDAGEDSYNVLPALLGHKRKKPIREATVYHSGLGRFAIRQGNWVFIDAPTGDENKEPEWLKKERGYEPHGQPGELYDLSADSGERRNLYAARPDKVRALKALLEKIKAAPGSE